MLPAPSRMRHPSDFSEAVRSGRRVGGRLFVVHHVACRASVPADRAPLVGFVVNKAVGGSVVRHRVARRLRAQVGARLDRLPAGSSTVVRALPASADAASTTLGAEFDRALGRLTTAATTGGRP